MSPSVTLTALCCLLAALSAHSKEPLYKQTGDSVVLSPDLSSVAGGITSIVWKHGADLAMEWHGRETDAYRQFKDRGNLNYQTGELSITGLMTNDSGVYTGEINGKVTSEIHLQVIAPVPKPTVFTSCNADVTSCLLTCDGDTGDAEPVTYSWKRGDDARIDLSKQQQITKNDWGYTEISCMMENPVSWESSEPISNPITEALERTRILWIIGGIFVLTVLLIAVGLMLFCIRRLRARADHLEEERERLKREKDSRQEHIERLKGEKEHLEKEKGRWKRFKGRWKKEAERLERENERLKGEKEHLEKEKESLKEKIASMQRKIDSKMAPSKSSGQKDDAEAAESNDSSAAAVSRPAEGRFQRFKGYWQRRAERLKTDNSPSSPVGDLEGDKGRIQMRRESMKQDRDSEMAPSESSGQKDDAEAAQSNDSSAAAVSRPAEEVGLLTADSEKTAETEL